MRNRSKTLIRRYGCAVVCAAVTVGARLLLDPILGDKFPFSTLLLGVTVASWYGGFMPAVTTMLLGAAATSRLVLQPRGSFAIDGFDYQVGTVVFLVSGFGISLLGAAMRRAQDRAERTAQELLASQRDLQDVMHGRLQTKERLSLTLQSIGDAVVCTDDEGRIAISNPVAAQFMGWPQSEAHGKPFHDLFKIVNEDTRKPIENPALCAQKLGAVVRLARRTILIAKDGSERTIDGNAAPIVNATGQTIGAVCVFREILAGKEAK